MKSRHYILSEKKAIACDLLTWAEQFENTNRSVADDKIGDVRISTVFLGLDHNFGEGPPLIFETMIFGGEHDGYCERFSTWEEAEAGHKKAIELIRVIH